MLLDYIVQFGLGGIVNKFGSRREGSYIHGIEKNKGYKIKINFYHDKISK